MDVIIEPMKTIPLTQGKVAIVDDEDYNRLIQYKWRYSKKHSDTPEKVSNSKGDITMHSLIIKCPGNHFIIHLNGDHLDNRKENLAILNPRQIASMTPPKQSKTGLKGVSLNKKKNKWEAYIYLNNKKQSLGYFNNPFSAAERYNDAASKYFGKYAYLNELDQMSPRDKYELRLKNDMRRKETGFKMDIVQKRISERLKKVKVER